jgi:hypothetical protein
MHEPDKPLLNPFSNPNLVVELTALQQDKETSSHISSQLVLKLLRGMWLAKRGFIASPQWDFCKQRLPELFLSNFGMDTF